MKPTAESIRRLQKDGKYRFDDLSREESRAAAAELAKAAAHEDRKYSTDRRFGIARDAFGYYYAAAIKD